MSKLRKTGAKIIATGVTVGTVLLTAIGVNVHNNINARPTPEKQDPLLSDGIIESPTLAPEPGPDGVVTESYTEAEKHETESFIGPVKEPTFEYEHETTTQNSKVESETENTKAKDQINTSSSEQVVDILGLLTNWFKGYTQDIFDLSSEPNITATALTNINIDANSGIVEIHGMLENNGTMRNYTAVVTNQDTNLSIFNLAEGDVTSELVDALAELKDSKTTTTSLTLKQNYKINNPSKAATDILQQRINYLNKLSSSNKAAQAEIKYLNEVLANVDSLDINLNYEYVYNKDMDMFTYTFKTYINTGKYVYTNLYSIESAYQLSNVDLQTEIDYYYNNALKKSTTTVAAASTINKLVYQINQESNNLNAESTKTK